MSLPQIIRVEPEYCFLTSMPSETHDRLVGRLLLAAMVLGLISLLVPWWNLIAFKNGQLSASFNSNLWGVMITGFLKSNFSYEWWSYTAFALVATGCFSFLLGYRSLKPSPRRTKRLTVLGSVLTIAACILYPIGLSYALPPQYSPSSFMKLWIIGTPSRYYTIGTYKLFYLGGPSGLQLTFAEFLSAGFFLALISIVLSLIVILMLTQKTSRAATESVDS